VYTYIYMYIYTLSLVLYMVRVSYGSVSSHHRGFGLWAETVSKAERVREQENRMRERETGE